LKVHKLFIQRKASSVTLYFLV